jgi:hypothetical protein
VIEKMGAARSSHTDFSNYAKKSGWKRAECGAPHAKVKTRIKFTKGKTQDAGTKQPLQQHPTLSNTI